MPHGNQTKTNSGQPPAGKGTKQTSAAKLDGLRKALQRERERARAIQRELRELRRLQRESGETPRAKGASASTRTKQNSQRRNQEGRPRQKPSAPDPRYQKIEQRLRREIDARLRDLPGETRGAVKEKLRGLDPADGLDLLDALGVGRQSAPKGVGAFAAGSPKGGTGLNLEELRRNPEKIKSLPSEQRQAILGQMGVRTSDKVF